MDEMVLLESATMRQYYCKEEFLGILDKVGQLATIPGTSWATTEQVANFYDVPENTFRYIIKRHRSEFLSDGYKIIPCNDFEKLHNATFEISNRGLAIFPRRAVLRTGMILRDSLRAKQVRTYLLNIEQNTKEIALYDRNQLILMADQLTCQAREQARHAQQLRIHADQLSENTAQLNHNANQLIAQAELIKAIVSEIYRNKKEIEANTESIRNMDNRVSSLENRASLNRMPVYEQLAECVTPEQVEEMKAKVKAIGKSPMKIWGKFNKHFRISRYRHLPQSKFQEAIEWLENIESETRFL